VSEKKILPGANIFSGEFKQPAEEEQWNLKEDPYITATKRLRESKKKPSPMRGSGKLALMLMDLLWSKGEPPLTSEKANFTTQSGGKAEASEEPKQVTTVATTSARPAESPQLVPARFFPRLSLFAPKTQQGPESKSTSSLGRGSPRKEEVYVEADSPYGRYLKKVSE